MPRRASWARTGFLLLALLASPARAVPAPDVEFTGDPVFTAAASGAAAAPQATFATWTGGRALTLDFGAVASALAAKSSITATQDFTVGAAGGRLDVRHAFQSRLGAADVAVTVSAKLLRKASGRVARSKKSLTLRSFKAKSKSAAAALTAAEDRATAALLAPGTWRLTVKVTYRKGRRDGLWSNAGWPAAPHVVTLGARPAATLYVATKTSGTPDGTPAHPFTSLADAIAAAPADATITLGPGTFGDGTILGLVRPISIEGAGMGRTVIDGTFVVSAPPGGQGVTVTGLTCDGVSFDSALPPGTAYAPIVVRACDVQQVRIPLADGPGHSYTIEDSRIRGDVSFPHGKVTDEARHAIVRCDVGGHVRYASGEGNTTNVVRDCRIAAFVGNASAGGGTLEITGNTIDGSDPDALPGQPQYAIADSSGATRTLIARNLLLHGISDSSDGRGSGPLPPGWPADWPEEDEVIEGNRILDGAIDGRGASITLRGNDFTRSTRGTVLRMRSGSPTHLIGNRITVPDATAADDPYAPGADAYATIDTGAGTGSVRDNVVRGGAFGLRDRSGAAIVSGNEFTHAYHGIYSSGAARFSGNFIHDCVGDGMLLLNARGPVDGNVITRNGGAGIRLLAPNGVWAPIDLGGGADGGLGGNVLRGNRGFDLVVEVPAADAATIFARNNVWDHATEAQIGELDIHDGRDDATKAVADILPIRPK